MMTSPKGNIFHVGGPLCRELTSPGFEISNWMHLSVRQVDCKNHLSECTIHLSEIYKGNATGVKIINMQSSFGKVLQAFHLSNCHFYSSQTMGWVKFRTLQSPVNSSQRPVKRSFDVFFDLHLNKPLSKQLWGWWFEMPSRSLWHQCNAICSNNYIHSVWAMPPWHVITVSKIRKNIYRSDIQVTFELCGHFRYLQVLYLKW